MVKLAPPPGVLYSVPRTTVTLIGLAEAPVTSSVTRPAAPDDSSAAELAVEIWMKGRSVSWIASSRLPTDPASLVVNCTRWKLEAFVNVAVPVLAAT
jgi:hypothetical protein